MRLVLDRSPQVCAWAAGLIPHMGGLPFPDTAVGLGVEADGKLIAAMVLSDWQPMHGTMQGTFAAIDPRWALAREALAWTFDYVFRECGVTKLWSVTPTSNKRALRLARHLGLMPEAILKRQIGGEDAVFSSLFGHDYYARRACLQQRQSTKAA